MSVERQHAPGDPFGAYRLERLLGRGAAAEVWQATESGDLGFTKRQALKLLQPPPGEMEAQKKALINEARVCGHLKHPGVVDVYRVGEQDGELFIAMEFVDGPDLNTLLVALRSRGVTVPSGAAVDAAIDLCDALEYAHRAVDGQGVPLNIVHRDLKPSNVLVDRHGGLLKISDWGLVKSTLNLESTTRGVVKGTPGYIAPEVWGGTRDFRPAADLFAVGAILWEMVVGERLFRGRNLARIAEQVAQRKPEEEAARVGAVCPPLEPVFVRLLQRVPLRRHQTAGELAEELRRVREVLPPRETLRRFLREIAPVLDEVAPPPDAARTRVAVGVGDAAADMSLDGLDQPPASIAHLGPDALTDLDEPGTSGRRTLNLAGPTQPMPAVDARAAVNLAGPTQPMAAVDVRAAVNLAGTPRASPAVGPGAAPNLAAPASETPPSLGGPTTPMPAIRAGAPGTSDPEDDAGPDGPRSTAADELRASASKAAGARSTAAAEPVARAADGPTDADVEVRRDVEDLAEPAATDAVEAEPSVHDATSDREGSDDGITGPTVPMAVVRPEPVESLAEAARTDDFDETLRSEAEDAALAAAPLPTAAMQPWTHDPADDGAPLPSLGGGSVADFFGDEAPPPLGPHGTRIALAPDSAEPAPPDGGPTSASGSGTGASTEPGAAGGAGASAGTPGDALPRRRRKKRRKRKKKSRRNLYLAVAAFVIVAAVALALAATRG